jgi:hypothetical protein
MSKSSGTFDGASHAAYYSIRNLGWEGTLSKLRFLALVIGVALIPMQSAGASGTKMPIMPTLVLPSHTHIQSVSGMTGRFAVLPAKNLDRGVALAQAAARTTIPLWKHQATYNSTPYLYEMVGRSPLIAEAEQTTDIQTVIVPIKLTFTSFGNATFDPNAKDQTCSPKGSASLLVSQSPIFNPIDGYPGGTYIGNGEYVDLFQRANYFRYTNPSGINPNYHTNLLYAHSAEVSVPVSGGDVVGGTCGNIGLIDFSTWDNYVQGTLFPLLHNTNPNLVPPTKLAVFLLYNVVLYNGSVSNCCILGYHSAFSDPAYGGAFHTYSSVEFDTNRTFTGVGDVSAMSHEIAEWMDDPDGNNPTPSWGNVGQVNGCQANLEVGDPLSGTLAQIYMPANRYTYHVQDLAFTSWFYRDTNSTGVNGWYSLLGNFLTPSVPC